MVLERGGDLRFIGPRSQCRAAVAVVGILVSRDTMTWELAMKKGDAFVLMSAANCHIGGSAIAMTSVIIIIKGKVRGQNNNNGKSYNQCTYRA